MHSSEELAELANLDTEVVEDAFDAADRLIPTSERNTGNELNGHQFDIPVMSTEGADVEYRIFIRDEGNETEIYADPDGSIVYSPEPPLFK